MSAAAATPARYSLRDLLPPAHILLPADNPNKKRTFEQAALLLENLSELPRGELFRQLIQRERQGSTAIGHYGAVPHIRMAIPAPLCVLTRLKKPVQYDADDSPSTGVHTLFFLVAPESAPDVHLKLLAIFAEMLADEGFMTSLEECGAPDAVHQAVIAWEDAHQDSLNDTWAGDLNKPDEG